MSISLENQVASTLTQPSFLHLESGESFSGVSPSWQIGQMEGEIVFTTGMTGYEASLTDPSYAGQIIVFTFPLIGNYGVLKENFWESRKIYARGVVTATVSSHYSHPESESSFAKWLEHQKVPLITNIDTRALTKLLREKGTVLGAISSTNLPNLPFKDPNLSCLAKEVSTKQKEIYGHQGKKIIAIDCGMKENILRHLRKENLIIEKVPYDYDYTNEEYDGLFISNGPGNPEMYEETITILKKAMQNRKPIFGICLGVQLLALAAGAKTYKLPYGHRSVNQPCLAPATKKCYMTSQNHGYAIDEATLPPEWTVSFKNLNDGTVEGIIHKHHPISGVQFHPEAAPGPTDTQWLFEQFIAAL